MDNINNVSVNAEYEGLDVSEYQGDIDFARVRENGFTAVYIRSSVGSDYVDPYLERNYKNARANEFKVGFYHYVTAVSVAQAREEADFFLKAIAGKTSEMRLAMDFETLSNISKETANQVAYEFLSTIEQKSGLGTVVYTNPNFIRNVWDSRIYDNYPLWLAQWGVSTPETGTWNKWIGWQYSDDGRVDGISGRVDLDKFTEEIFLDESTPLPGNPEEPGTNLTKLICITVEWGDTLTYLARKYDTTVSSLVKLNNIKNPNRIYTGQRLYVRVLADAEGQCCDSYTIQRGDTLYDIARRFSTTVRHLAEVNNISNPDRIYAGEVISLGLC